MNARRPRADTNERRAPAAKGRTERAADIGGWVRAQGPTPRVCCAKAP